MADDLGPLGPLLVAGLAILVIAISQPLSGDLWGIPMNLAAILIVGLGGLLGTANPQ